MLDKMKKLVENRGLSTYEIVHNTGSVSRTNILEPVINGDKEITSTNFNNLSAFARGLGVTIEDILEDYDYDGTTAQILNIERTVKRFIKHQHNGTIITENEDGGYVIGAKYDENTFKTFPILKKDFEIIEKDKLHSEQLTEPIYLLNKRWLNTTNKNTYLTKNNTLTNLMPKLNKYSMAFFIYSPIYDNNDLIGGDFKLAITVTDKNNMFFFSEVYGCEWLKTEETRHIVYYKAYNEHLYVTPERIEEWEKEEISELEYWKAIYTQFFKFGISK